MSMLRFFINGFKPWFDEELTRITLIHTVWFRYKLRSLHPTHILYLLLRCCQQKYGSSLFLKMPYNCPEQLIVT